MTAVDTAQAQPSPPAGTRAIVTIFNQKGGIGKTTTCVNLAVCLAAAGYRVALIDVDSQSNATTSLGLVGARASGTYPLLKGNAILGEVMEATAYPGLSVCRADDDLAGIELELALEAEPHFMLRHSLENGPLPVDVVLIDCPPALGMLPVNALAASDLVLVPVAPEPLARDGLHRAWRHIQRVRARLNPKLEVAGIVVTMGREVKVHDALSRILRDELGSRILPHEIPFDPQVVEASRHDVPVAVFDPACPAARAYLALAAALAAHIGRLGRGRKGAAPSPSLPSSVTFDADRARATLYAWRKQLSLPAESGELVPLPTPVDQEGWVGVADGPADAAPSAPPPRRGFRPPPARPGMAAMIGLTAGGLFGAAAAMLSHIAGWVP